MARSIVYLNLRKNGVCGKKESKMTLDDFLSKQISPNNKTGLGYASYANRKSNNNKKVFGGNKAPKGNVPKNDHTGLDNPNYELFNSYGNVYARYIGPYDGFIAYSIWVPKTLVTNMRGPIVKWVPKTKQ